MYVLLALYAVAHLNQKIDKLHHSSHCQSDQPISTYPSQSKRSSSGSKVGHEGL